MFLGAIVADRGLSASGSFCLITFMASVINLRPVDN